MSEKAWSVIIALSIIFVLASIAISGILNNKIKNDNFSSAYCYEITTNEDEKIINRGTGYEIDEMGNLSIMFNNEKLSSFSYGCWTKIVEVENAPKTD